MSAPIETLPSRGFRSKYFAKEILALKIFCVSLTGNDSQAYRIYSLVCIIAFRGMYTVLASFEMFKHDFSVVSDFMVYEMGAIIGLVKLVAFLWNRQKFLNLLIRLEQEPFLPNAERGGDVEIKLHKECVSITTAQTMIYYIFCGFSILGKLSFTLYKRVRSDDFNEWVFPYGPFTVLNVTYSPNYEICCCYQSLSMSLIGGGFVASDTLILTVLTHCCYQFKMLQHYIKGLVETSNAIMVKERTGTCCIVNSNSSYHIDGSTIPLKYLDITLKRAVDYHLAVIEIVQDVEELFTYPILVFFLGSLAIICFAVYQTSSIGYSAKLLTFMSEGIIGVCQVLLFCYWSEEVKHESEQVGLAAYESNFVGTDLRFQKGLAMIMRRSQNPSRLTVGKFADVGVRTFVWILRTSYSSFMILRRRNQN